MIARLREEDGQGFVLLAFLVIAFIGAIGLMVDVGQKFRSDRRIQGVADAAAIAGAEQLLCSNNAVSTAIATAGRPPNNVPSSAVTATTHSTLAKALDGTPMDDTIDVTIVQTPNVAFSKVFGLSTFNTHASATAQAFVPPSVRDATLRLEPLMADQDSFSAATKGVDLCSGAAVSMRLAPGPGPGAFGLLDLGNCTTPGSSDPIGDFVAWIQDGYKSTSPDYRGDITIGTQCHQAPASMKLTPSSPICPALQMVAAQKVIVPIVKGVPCGHKCNSPSWQIVSWAAYAMPTGFTCG